MTTKSSPPRAIRFQAQKIVATLKAAERGDVRFVAKIEEARTRGIFKVGIVMDDKVIILEMPWTTIKETEEQALVECIIGQMTEARQQ